VSDALEKLIPSNSEAPHKGILWIRAEVHEITKTGECTGNPVYKVETFPVAIDGADRHICIRKLNEILAEFKEKCSAK
jgi:hypothetical protein